MFNRSFLPLSLTAKAVGDCYGAKTMTTSFHGSAINTVLTVCSKLRLDWVDNSNEMTRLIREELRPFSHTFRLVGYSDQNQKMVHAYYEIYANDDGCVNQGMLLATCWVDENGKLYWEA